MQTTQPHPRRCPCWMLRLQMRISMRNPRQMLQRGGNPGRSPPPTRLQDHCRAPAYPFLCPVWGRPTGQGTWPPAASLPWARSMPGARMGMRPMGTAMGTMRGTPDSLRPFAVRSSHGGACALLVLCGSFGCLSSLMVLSANPISGWSGKLRTALKATVDTAGALLGSNFKVPIVATGARLGFAEQWHVLGWQ